jgi:hypothetical protein
MTDCMLATTTSYYPNFHVVIYKLKMNKKLAKIKYLPNNFEIIEEGDHVICAVSGKKINLNTLNYWNVDLQEPYYSYKEAAEKRETE